MGNFFPICGKDDGQRLHSDLAQFDMTSFLRHKQKSMTLENFLDML